MKQAITEAGNIVYREYGQGQPLLLLHGTLSNSNTWRLVIPQLANHFHCITPDLPLGAHSLPLHETADLSPVGIAELIHQFLVSISIEQAIIVGNDTGGAYAQLFAAMYPDMVTALVLCNCDALEIFPPKAFASLQKAVDLPGFTWVMAQAFRMTPFLKSKYALGLLSAKVTKEILYEQYVKSFVQQRGVRADFRKAVKGWSPHYTMQAALQLTTFLKPVLIIWGSDDVQLFPLELGQRLHNVFPHASLVTINDSLTYAQEDQPEIFANTIIEHFIINKEETLIAAKSTCRSS